MRNPFSLALEKSSINAGSQGAGYARSYLYLVLKLGEAAHATNPTEWQASSITAFDECLYRLRAYRDTFAYKDMAALFQETH